MITIQHTKEALSRAYILAVAGKAGHNLVLERTFDYSVDGSFRQVEHSGSRRRETGFALDFQAKASVSWSERTRKLFTTWKSKLTTT
jgi:hypothetical protein